MKEIQTIGKAFETIMASIVDQAAKRILSHVQNNDQSPAQLIDCDGFDLMRAYSAKEVARLLGINRVASVYEIPENELPRVRRIGTSIGFLGINVLCYMHGQPPVDMGAAIEQYRDRLMKDRPNIRALYPSNQVTNRIL